MSAWEIRRGDCIEAMAAMEDCSIDAIVTDPPYGISFMGRAWDTFDPATMEKRVGVRNGTGPPSYDSRTPVSQKESGVSASSDREERARRLIGALMAA